MATTRSRRSAGGGELNPAMIQLYDTGRLRRELKQRGLDTTGTRNVLADRLQEAVLSERNSRQTYSPPPQSEKLTKKGVKRTSKGSEGNENEMALDSERSKSPRSKKKRISEEIDEINLIEESFSIELSNISSVDEIQMEAEKAFLPQFVPSHAQASQQGDATPTKESALQLEEESVKSEILLERHPGIKIRIRSPKKAKSSETEKEKCYGGDKKLKEDAVDEEQQSSSSDEELKWVNKTRKEKQARNALYDERQSSIEGDPENDNGTLPAFVNSAAEEDVSNQKDEITKERDVKSSSVAEGVSAKERKDRPLLQKGPIKIKFKTSLLATDKSIELKQKEAASLPSFSIGKEGKQHFGAVVASTSQPDESHEKPKRAFTPPLSASSAEKAKEQPSRKKIPIRMQAPVDVLDSIFDKQAELLSSKYKTEQERALERQKLELAKRRQNAVLLPPPITSSSSPAVLEKRRQTVDFVLPSKSSLEHRPGQNPIRPPSSDFRPPAPLSIRERTTMDEKRMLAKLPPPPPPPPLLPCPSKGPLPSMPSSASSSSSSTLNLEQPRSGSFEGLSIDNHDRVSFATSLTTPCSTDSPSSINTPPSIPSHKSSSEMGTPSEIVHSSDASTSSTISISKMDTERIKEMASALQAVFARLGNIPPVPGHSEVDVDPIGGSRMEGEICSDVLDSDAALTPQDAPALFVADEQYVEVTTRLSNEEEAIVLKSQDSVAPVQCSELEKGENFELIVQRESAERCSCLQDSGMSASTQDVLDFTDDDHSVDSLTKGTGNNGKEQFVDPVVAEVIRDTIDNLILTENTEMQIESEAAGDETTETKEIERKPDISEELLRDPRRLLQKASDVLKSLQSLEIAAAAVQTSADKPNQQYEQLPLDDKYEEDDDEDKPLPDFHGEPVPDSDDEIIIEGVTRKRSNKKNLIQEEEPVPGDEEIEIDFYNADLNIKASETSQEVIDPDNGDGFALMWGGARSTYGIQIPSNVSGFPGVIFQIKLLECLPIKHLPFEELDAYDVRIGWSAQNSTNILGEALHSYAYSILAKKATNNFFTDYGEHCQTGDVITSCLDLASGRILFWKNTEYLGVAFSDVSFDGVVFPHVCTKNYKLAVNYGDSRLEGWTLPDELIKDAPVDIDLIYYSYLDRRRLVRGLVPPSSKSECTVLMMVGLPGVGKTTWVRQYLRDHPQEQWNLLSTDTVLAAMKVNGIPRSRVHHGRWDMVMGLIAKALNRSLHLACRRRRNYIIDQTNVSKDARRRKLSQFKDFQRKCVVIIPSEEEMIARQMKQSRMDGAGPIPVEAMLELKAMLSIPNVETEPIEDVFFVEPPLERIGDAIDLVMRFNEEARPWCQKRRGRRGEPLRQNDSRLTINSNSRTPNETSAVTTNASAADGTPSNRQSSPGILRSNESQCRLGREVPSSLTSSSASSWAERKSVVN